MQRSKTDRTDALWSVAAQLWETWSRAHFQPLRLIGFSVDRLRDAAEQLELFEDEQATRRRRLDQAVDAINQRFGRGAVQRKSR